MNKIKPINLGGKYLSSQGPLPIPPSAQGQPVIFQAGGGREGLELAGRYASGVYANPFDIPSAMTHRAMVRQSVTSFGRNPNEIKLLPGLFRRLHQQNEKHWNDANSLISLSIYQGELVILVI